GQPVPFAKLLERVHEVDGIDRIRFVTSYPADWDEDIFRVMRDYPKVMPYLHIPAQSGSDAVLKRMRRGYTADTYLRLMDTARKYVPHISLAGDFIVGFCGETDAEFAASVDLVRRVDYKSLYIFKYSPRPGTTADRNQQDDVPTEVKQARNQELLAVQSEISQRHRRTFIGQSVRVLVEGFSKLHGKPSAAKIATMAAGDWSQESEQDRGSEVSREATGQLVGRTPGDLIAVFDAPQSYVGAIVDVYIEGATALTLYGRVTSVVSPPRAASVPQRKDAATVVKPGVTALPIVGAGCE
ncbi:MAG: radical SAM protein, partial [Phycisphaerae bacterium]